MHVASINLANQLNIWSNIVVVVGGLAGAGGFAWTAHRKHRDRLEHQSETRKIVDELTKNVEEHGETLKRIERKLVPNGRNTQNPGDLLAIICDKLGIELPGDKDLY